MLGAASFVHEKEWGLVQDLSREYSPLTFFRNWHERGFVEAIKEDWRFTWVRHSADVRRLKRIYEFERRAYNAKVCAGEISGYYEYESPLDFARKRNRTYRAVSRLKALSPS